MSTILVVAEHLDGELKKATLNTLQFANEAAAIEDGEVVGLVLGSGADAVASAMADACARVIYVEDAAFTNYLAEAYAPKVIEVAQSLDTDVVVAAATTTGKDFMPRVRALEGGMISDAIAVYEDEDESQLAYKRPILSGNLIAKVTSDADVTCVTVRTTRVRRGRGRRGRRGGQAHRRGRPDNAEFLQFHFVESDRPELTDADVVIAGGRGLKSAEAFGIIEGLADALGAAVGASRAAVDLRLRAERLADRPDR